jgi:hypothetical protein
MTVTFTASTGAKILGWREKDTFAAPELLSSLPSHRLR